MMDVFDDNILRDIIVHLSLKQKVQCKAVCKRWLHLISSRCFAEHVLAKHQGGVSVRPWYLLYQSDYTSNPKDDLILGVAYKYNPEFTIESFDQLEYGHEAILPASPWPRVYAAHNGLLLCEYGFRAPLSFFVCNPLTKQRVFLPRPSSSDVIGFIVSCGNGSSTFKVVRVRREYRNDSYVYGNIKVFSSEVGEWMDTGVAWPGTGYLDNWRDVGVVHDGKLHWSDTTETSSSIIAYDPDKNECRVLSFNVPHSLSFERGVIGTSCGRLCCANFVEFSEDVLCVCVMENYETEEWRPLLITQLRNILDVNEIHDDFFDMFSMAFHPFDMNTVYFQTSCKRRGLVSLNLQTLKLSYFSEEVRRGYGQCTEWTVFSYVVPPWVTALPQQIWETGNDLQLY